MYVYIYISSRLLCMHTYLTHIFSSLLASISWVPPPLHGHFSTSPRFWSATWFQRKPSSVCLHNKEVVVYRLHPRLPWMFVYESLAITGERKSFGALIQGYSRMFLLPMSNHCNPLSWTSVASNTPNMVKWDMLFAAHGPLACGLLQSCFICVCSIVDLLWFTTFINYLLIPSHLLHSGKNQHSFGKHLFSFHRQINNNII